MIVEAKPKEEKISNPLLSLRAFTITEAQKFKESLSDYEWPEFDLNSLKSKLLAIT